MAETEKTSTARPLPNAGVLSQREIYDVNARAAANRRAQEKAEDFNADERPGIRQDEVDTLNKVLKAAGGTREMRERIERTWERGMDETMLKNAINAPIPAEQLDQTRLVPAVDEAAVTEGDMMTAGTEEGKAPKPNAINTGGTVVDNKEADAGQEVHSNLTAQPPRAFEKVSTTARPEVKGEAKKKAAAKE